MADLVDWETHMSSRAYGQARGKWASLMWIVRRISARIVASVEVVCWPIRRRMIIRSLRARGRRR